MVIEDVIRNYIVTSVALPTAPADHDRLADRGFVASVRLLDLVGFLEDTFSIRLRAGDIVPEKLATIAQISTVVRARLPKQAR